ncbi:hypothetical protein NMG60_11012824 [Bertholletia excelsa]
MARWCLFLCLALLLSSHLISEAHRLDPLAQKKERLASYRAVLEQAEVVYNFRLKNGEFDRSKFQSLRSSPGGPDPQHH